MHMMGLAKIPLILLFGPTDSKNLLQNTGVKVVDSKIIYNSKDLNKISVEDV